MEYIALAISRRQMMAKGYLTNLYLWLMSEKLPKAQLSKSTFIKGLQCSKALYLYKKRPFLRDKLSAEQRAKFTRGTHVGLYARQLFPGGADATPATHFQMAQSVLKTAEFIRQGHQVIYEAAFQYQEVIIALDILYQEQGQWKALEVKSSKSISDTYLWDAALQYYVISGSGIDLKAFSIAHIDTSYQLQGALDPHGLFRMLEVTGQVQERQDAVALKLEELKGVLELKQSPRVSIGLHCHDPYTCEFVGHCWKGVPTSSVFSLTAIPEEEQFALYEQGVVAATDVPEPWRSHPGVDLHLQSLSQARPLAQPHWLGLLQEKLKHKDVLFLHSLGFEAAMPLYTGAKPYEPLVWGLAWQVGLDGPMQLHLVPPGQFPPDSLSEFLKQLLAGNFPVLCFDKSREKLFLQRIEAGLPQMELARHAERMEGLQEAVGNYQLVWPDTIRYDTPEQVLQGLGLSVEAFPQGLVIQQEAAVLYQGLMQNQNLELYQEDTLETLTRFMQARMENLLNIYRYLDRMVF